MQASTQQCGLEHGMENDVPAVGSKSGFCQLAIGHSSVCNSSCEPRGARAGLSGFTCALCVETSAHALKKDATSTYKRVWIPEELSERPILARSAFSDRDARLHAVLRICGGACIVATVGVKHCGSRTLRSSDTILVPTGILTRLRELSCNSSSSYHGMRELF